MSKTTDSKHSRPRRSSLKPEAAPCPVCRAPRGWPCSGNGRGYHEARVALRLAEEDAVALPADSAA